MPIASIQIYSYPYKFCSATHDLHDQNLYTCMSYAVLPKTTASPHGIVLKWFVRVNTTGIPQGDEQRYVQEFDFTQSEMMVPTRGVERWQHRLSDWWLAHLLYRSFIILWQGPDDGLKRWNEGCTLGDPSAASETRPSIHSSNRTQADSNHYGHVLLESRLTVICAACRVVGDWWN